MMNISEFKSAGKPGSPVQWLDRGFCVKGTVRRNKHGNENELLIITVSANTCLNRQKKTACFLE
jgi:hypothetical protein